MVLTVGDDDDGAAMGLVGERLQRQVDGFGDGRALRRHELRVDGREEHASRRIVGGDGQLDESLVGKDDNANTVATHLADQLVDSLLGAFQTAGYDVLGIHRVRHVDGDVKVDALTLHLLHLAAALQVGQGQDRASDDKQEDDELQGGTTGRIARHQLLAHPNVGKTLETPFLAEAEQNINDDQYRNDQQPVKVLGMFESQYVFHSFNPLKF